jgi:hypothetical protein
MNKSINKTNKTMIKLSTRKWATIKKTAQIVQPSVAKRIKLQEQIEKLVTELAEVDATISEWDGAVRRMTGYSSSDLVVRVIEPTGKVDAKGVPVKVTKWLPSPLVTFNEEENTYEIPEKVYPTIEEAVAMATPVDMDIDRTYLETTETAEEE